MYRRKNLGMPRYVNSSTACMSCSRLRRATVLQVLELVTKTARMREIRSTAETGDTRCRLHGLSDEGEKGYVR
jgi:hypothetical protein